MNDDSLWVLAASSGMGMEVCTTLGMLSPDQARRLKEAGLTAYNHNLDTSREFYPSVRSRPSGPKTVCVLTRCAARR